MLPGTARPIAASPRSPCDDRHRWSVPRFDGGYSGGSTDRPALQRLLTDIRDRRINVVVYKVNRLTPSLADFAKLVELFDAHGVSLVSVTRQFNTITSMGRLTLNVLRSFAQFESEVTGERIRTSRRLQTQGVMGRRHSCRSPM
jgi:DNA invertase Pin-like site-specific DNA recombinase